VQEVVDKLPPPHVLGLTQNDYGEMLLAVERQVAQDFAAYLKRDPAAHGNGRLVDHAYRCFRAVVHYRFAHHLLRLAQSGEAGAESLEIEARSLSEEAKARTGVEIHPGVRIGTRFVIDHGYNTVIGETAEIGDDCYILQNVTLGGRRIADNPRERRHPILGNRVEVASNVRILGRVKIGDDAFIGSGCTVIDDVPPGGRVIPICQIQIRIDPAGASPSPEIDAVFQSAENPAALEIRGRNIMPVTATFHPSLTDLFSKSTYPCRIVHQDERKIVIELSPHASAVPPTAVAVLTWPGRGLAILSPSRAIGSVLKAAACKESNSGH
jgi:serine O-acetyltransferase